MRGLRNIPILFKLIGIALTLLFIWLSILVFQPASLYEQLMSLLEKPFVLLALVIFYSAAFVLRAFAWRLYLQNKVSLQKCLAGLLYSLFINHLSPLKVGDAVRAAVFKNDKEVTLLQAAHSVVVLRMLDMLILVIFSGTGLLYLYGKLQVNLPVLAVLAMGAAAVFITVKIKFPGFLKEQISQLKQGFRGLHGAVIILLIALSWIFEAVVIFGIASPESLSFMEAVWVNSVTISGQVFQVTPGGVGTYETVMTFALNITGASMKEAYEYAVISHGFKFVFSYAGGIAAFLLLPLQVRELTYFMKRKERLKWRK
ncbi:lysylphosphatidylglycerol synthase transmembrane domain-containing protein [Metabacillus idriensis]|uniref:lysylphosphatidylglycerol synthase transmembrane domain-containing protein n=1 Tax=Metabacillus idriensis TaxID=324768 RepID=UPI0028138D0E|nr:lysylphosphatidylglycerol synthase transmembrane domain-containing protein [Metabacillus idriensis]MDR0138672.1 lysylphosphatidylglycerol synthase transmembrane domain-containing protein [Metabacillus idriensis]